MTASTGLSRRAFGGLLAALATPISALAQAGGPLVFAAASLQAVLPAAVAAGGRQARFSFGASSALARQMGARLVLGVQAHTSRSQRWRCRGHPRAHSSRT